MLHMRIRVVGFLRRRNGDVKDEDLGYESGVD